MSNQVITGDSGPDAEDGKIKTPRNPQPLQGEADPSIEDDPQRQRETGNEGAGT